MISFNSSTGLLKAGAENGLFIVQLRKRICIFFHKKISNIDFLHNTNFFPKGNTHHMFACTWGNTLVMCEKAFSRVESPFTFPFNFPHFRNM